MPAPLALALHPPMPGRPGPRKNCQIATPTTTSRSEVCQIPAASCDLSNWMPFKPDRMLLREYHAAMADGELQAAAAAWDQLAEQNWDRIKQAVKLFRFSTASNKGIPELDQGSAASYAYLRVRALGANFRKQEVEAYYAAIWNTTQYACRDFGRRDFRHTKRSAGSLDQRFDPESEVGPYSGALAAWEAARREEAAEREVEDLELQREDGLILWAISQLKNDKYREVLEMTYDEKLTADEIAKRLGISVENAYQRRSRGLRELKKILDERDS
jgi:RNA polymerase sigma factor (sigma-70 family)